MFVNNVQPMIKKRFYLKKFRHGSVLGFMCLAFVRGEANERKRGGAKRRRLVEANGSDHGEFGHNYLKFHSVNDAFHLIGAYHFTDP